MSEVKYTVRNMTKEDVPQTLDIWRETGMQEGTRCLYTWLKVDPEAFKIAVTDEEIKEGRMSCFVLGTENAYHIAEATLRHRLKKNDWMQCCKCHSWLYEECSNFEGGKFVGEVVGSCSACIHHEDLVFVGLYAVRKKYRGIGAGMKVWNACMEHVGSRNVCLNAVPDKIKLYRDKAGFPIVETDWVCLVNETQSNVNPEHLSDTPPAGIEIKSFEESHLPIIYDYDEKLVNYNRQLALELTFKEEDSRTFVAVKDGICVGFGTIKMSCQGGGQVGPLYADSKEIAEVILKKLILSLPQAKGFAMMTVSNNQPANELMARIGCPMTEECPRMYRKKKVNIDLSKVFGQFDLNFSPY